MRIIGIDPGLQRMGWGVLDSQDNRLSFVAEGTLTTKPKTPLSERLVELYDGLVDDVETWAPDQASVEETFVYEESAERRNPNPSCNISNTPSPLISSPLFACFLSNTKMMSCLRVLETLSNPISWAVARSSAIGFCFNSVRFMYLDLLVRLGLSRLG